METVDDRTFKEKFDRFIFDRKEDGKKAWKWVKENQTFVMMMTPVILEGVLTVGKSVSRRNEKIQLERKIYDRSNGHSYHMRRSLSNDEWLEFDRRKASGESVGEILLDMKAIKAKRR